MKRSKGNSLFFISPLRATEALREIGEEYDKKAARLYYIVLLFVALVLGLLFELRPIFLFIVILVYLICVPQIVFNQRKFAYETMRFNDVNSYMSQMAQSFVYTQDVITSLEETVTCFPKGRMKNTLNQALQIIEDGKRDVKRSEIDALKFIESRYECEKVKNLHNFFLNAQRIGGECRKEFRILEKTRTSWQYVVEGIRMKKFWERNIGAMMYAFFLGVCIIMLHVMRNSELEIMNMMITQIVDLLLLVGFVVYFVFMDNRLNRSLLMNPEVMSEEKANSYFDYLESYDSKRERRKYRSFAVFAVVVSVVLIYIKPSGFTLVLAICLIFAGFNIHTIIHVDVVHMLRKEISKAFPRWLFDVMLHLQRESVEGAIEKSIETAPPVLKRDLERVVSMLSLEPHDPDAYMSFLRDFNIQSVNEIMHKLYSLAVGANRDSDVLDVVMEKNMKNLEKAERDSLTLRDSMVNFTWVPFLCVGFGCIGYLVIAIMTSVNGIINLIR